VSSQTTPAAPPKIAGWLILFIARFYISAALIFIADAASGSKLYIGIGAVELLLGILLSLRNRTGLILTRIWLIFECAVFAVLATAGFMTLAKFGAVQFLLYSISCALVAVYFFCSKRVKLTYPKMD